MIKATEVKKYTIGTEAVFVVPSESEAIDMVSQTLQKIFAYAKLEVSKVNENHVITFTGHHNGKDAIQHILWLRKVGGKTYLIIPLLEDGLGELEGHLKLSEVAFADQFAEQWM